MDPDAIGGCLALELLEIVGEMRERMLLDLRCQLAQLFPFGDMMRLAVALLAQIPEPGVVKRLVLLACDETRGGFRMVEAPHSRAPFRICAMWMNLMPRPRRSAQPF